MKIYIRPVINTLNDEVFIITSPGPRSGDVGSYITFDLEGKAILTTIVRDGSDHDVKPAFILPTNTVRELVTAFSDYAKSQGIESDSESKAKGKLEATERHLTDLRTLLKLK
jgi:hypothetical protein